MCSPKAQGETPINATAYNKGHTHWLGSASHVQSYEQFDLRPGVQDIPSLVVSLRAPWLELPLSDFVNSMNTIHQGVLNGIFRQMPIAAWFRAQCKRIQLTIVLPSKLPLADWQTTLLRRTSCWPCRLPQDLPVLHPPSKATFIRLRKRDQSKHILGGLVVN